MAIQRSQITGIVLAGGRGSRMGGVDKGLQLHAGQPLAWHAVQRLAPQVGGLLVSANRNAAAYAALGWPVLADAPDADPACVPFAGPLAGVLAGLQHCRTPYLATVPCDAPHFPHDLVLRLAQALDAGPAAIAMAATRGGRGQPHGHAHGDGHAHAHAQPVFCLMRSALRDKLAADLARGQRGAQRWAQEQGCVQVVFDDAAAFTNVNTAADLQALRSG